METVTISVVVGLRSRYLEIEVPNEHIAEYVKRSPRTRIGFAGIDPMDGDILKRIDDLVAMGFMGMTISPSDQDYHPSHSAAMQLYERCESEQLPVMVHQGTVMLPETKMEYAHPVLFDEIARTFPDLKFILAHVGHPWTDETLMLCAKHRNVYADLSDVINRPWQLYNTLVNANALEVTDRLLFGSDFPFSKPADAIKTIYSLYSLTHGTHLPNVPREKVRSIVERNVLECLGLVGDGTVDIQRPTKLLDGANHASLPGSDSPLELPGTSTPEPQSDADSGVQIETSPATIVAKDAD